MSKEKDIPKETSSDKSVEALLVSKTPEELSHEWEKKEMKLPRMVFWYINLYQFGTPIFVLMGLSYLIYWLYGYFEVSILYQILIAPGIFILYYSGYIWMMIKLCKWLNHYFEKKSPPHEGVYSREFSGNNVTNIEVHYYHLRGFLYKWPVFCAKKSMFPWMQMYALREMSGSKVHRDAWYGDCYVGLEFTAIEEGVVIMDGTSLSSHVVDSIFGSLSILTIHLRKNAVIHANVIIGPGAQVEAGTSIAPKVLLPKRWKQKGQAAFYWGDPVPFGKTQRGSFTEYLPEPFKSQWAEKQKLFENLVKN